MQRLIAFILFVAIVSIGNHAHALVMVRNLRAGEIPGFCPAEVRKAMAKVQSIGGRETDGFGFISASIYCRGTHEEIQELLDNLGQINDVPVSLTIDASGKPGVLPPNKRDTVQRSRWYIYRINMHKRRDHAPKLAPNSSNFGISITIHSTGGVRPNELRLSGNTVKASAVSKSLSKVAPIEPRSLTK